MQSTIWCVCLVEKKLDRFEHFRSPICRVSEKDTRQRWSLPCAAEAHSAKRSFAVCYGSTLGKTSGHAPDPEVATCPRRAHAQLRRVPPVRHSAKRRRRDPAVTRRARELHVSVFAECLDQALGEIWSLPSVLTPHSANR